jgi:hypothetical protein
VYLDGGQVDTWIDAQISDAFEQLGNAWQQN